MGTSSTWAPRIDLPLPDRRIWCLWDNEVNIVAYPTGARATARKSFV